MKLVYLLSLLVVVICSQVRADLLDGLDHHDHHDDHHDDHDDHDDHHDDHDDHFDHFDDVDFNDDRRRDNDDKDDDDDSFEVRLLNQINAFLPRRDFAVSQPKSFVNVATRPEIKFDFEDALSQLLPDDDDDDDNHIVVINDLQPIDVPVPQFNFQPPPQPAVQRAPPSPPKSNFQSIPLPAAPLTNQLQSPARRQPVPTPRVNVQPSPRPQAPVNTNFRQSVPAQKTNVASIQRQPNPQSFGIVPETNSFEINRQSEESFQDVLSDRDDEDIVVVLRDPILEVHDDLDVPSLALDRSHIDFDDFSDNSISSQGRQLETQGIGVKPWYELTAPADLLSSGQFKHQPHITSLTVRGAPAAPNSFDLLDGEYPTFRFVPETSFDCADHPLGGYYADIEADCQVFHICLDESLMGSFLCPNGTLFNQQHFVCDWWFNVDCSLASQNFELNARIGVIPDDSDEFDGNFDS